MKKIIILIITTFILGIIQLYFSIWVGARGIELGEIEKEIQELQVKNRDLEGEIAQLYSYSGKEKIAIYSPAVIIAKNYQ